MSLVTDEGICVAWGKPCIDRLKKCDTYCLRDFRRDLAFSPNKAMIEAGRQMLLGKYGVADDEFVIALWSEMEKAR